MTTKTKRIWPNSQQGGEQQQQQQRPRPKYQQRFFVRTTLLQVLLVIVGVGMMVEFFAENYYEKKFIVFSLGKQQHQEERSISAVITTASSNNSGGPPLQDDDVEEKEEGLVASIVNHLLRGAITGKKSPSTRTTTTKTTTTTEEETPQKQQQQQPAVVTTNPNNDAASTSLACLKVRGQRGKWIPASLGTQYTTPLQEGAGRKDRQFRRQNNNANNEYLPSTKWTWQQEQEQEQEHDHNNNDNCSIQLLSPEGLCNVLIHQLGINRIMLVGDSLTYMMTQSLWKLLGNNDDPGTQFQPFQRWFDCSAGGSGGIEAETITTTTHNQSTTNAMLEIQFVRNDHLQTTTQQQQEGSTCINREGGICNSWIDLYSSASTNPTIRTLLIVNTGLHSTYEGDDPTNATHAFQQDIDNFVNAITNINRSTADDLIMFRTSVPGHKNCIQHNMPYSNYSQYQQQNQNNIVKTDYDDYGWEKVEGFNAYVKEKWSNLSSSSSSSHNQQQQQSPGSAPKNTKQNWYLLDVYPMTVLRPDGHRPPRDCLHYFLPGPPDWWNHLLYSNLLDIATATAAAAAAEDTIV